ncbi:MAG: PAS domain-containing protein, partial [Acidobacteriota bacterium]|nr:PAS domain-containing protein [Acidobacteriota bacterium]
MLEERNALEALVVTLTRERASLAAIIQQAPAFICTLRGPEHVFELANDRYYDLIGRRDIIGKTARAALPEVAGQGFFELLDSVYQTGESITGSETAVRLNRHDGPLERRFVNFVYQPLRGPDGAATGVLVHGIDVTDLVFTREAIQASEARFRQLADAMPQIVWAATPDGQLDYYNRRWFEYIRIPPGVNEDTVWDRYIHPDDLPETYAAWRVALSTGDPYSVEFRVRGGDGAYRWFLARALP